MSGDFTDFRDAWDGAQRWRYIWCKVNRRHNTIRRKRVSPSTARWLRKRRIVSRQKADEILLAALQTTALKA